MTFSQLIPGVGIHVLEIVGTFKKSTSYSLGTVISVSKPYDEPMQPGQFQLPQNRRKLVDVIVSCDGEQKKLSVSEDKTMMTDPNIGLTVATEKEQIVNMVRQSYNDCKAKKESVARYDEEMRRCEDILKLLNSSIIPINIDNSRESSEINALKAEIKEMKTMLLQRNTTKNIDPPVVSLDPVTEEKSDTVAENTNN